MNSTAYAATLIPTGTWAVDPAHSAVGFSVKHLGIATVRGRFEEFEGTLEIGDDLSTARAFGTAQVNSINTDETARDEHLRSADFFGAEANPELRFESTSVRPLDEDTFEIEGDLTMNGVTNPVTLNGGHPGHRDGPVGQRPRRPRGHGPREPQRLEHDLQPGTRERQPPGRREGHAEPRHLGGEAGLRPAAAGRLAGCKTCLRT